MWFSVTAYAQKKKKKKKKKKKLNDYTFAIKMCCIESNVGLI